MKMMLPDVIGHKNQSQHYQHHRCLCLELSGRITTPARFSYHTGARNSSNLISMDHTTGPRQSYALLFFIQTSYELYGAIFSYYCFISTDVGYVLNDFFIDVVLPVHLGKLSPVQFPSASQDIVMVRTSLVNQYPGRHVIVTLVP